MARAVKWVRKILNRSNTKDEPPPCRSVLPPGLPILPRKRERVLTPLPTQETLVRATATAESAFFQRLPLELRLKIYAEAFGQRTVHMDLRYDYPELPGPSHARLDPDRMNPRDTTVPPAWCWWSSVCHRHPLLEAWADECRTGMGTAACHLYPGEMPEKCFLGAMGWLLSCRQA